MRERFGNEWLREVPFDPPDVSDVRRELGGRKDALVLATAVFAGAGEHATCGTGWTHRRRSVDGVSAFFKTLAAAARYPCRMSSNTQRVRGTFDVKMSAEPPF